MLLKDINNSLIKFDRLAAKVNMSTYGDLTQIPFFQTA